ncbi:MAG: hypothetical protein J5843_03185 [Clostridia bacterium]|nr:hypothetical protein [Clostridia bacterium]
MPVRFLADSSAVLENPTVPQWAATIILIAALVLCIGMFAFFLRAIRKNKDRTGRY